MNIADEKSDPLFHGVGPESNAEAAKDQDACIEKHILKFSVYSTLGFAAVALVWGTLIRSQMLVFDGIYSFVSMLMTSVFVYSAKVMNIADDDKFPFGRSQTEPMVIVLKALVIIVVCGGALGRAAVTLTSGGRDINTLSAALYSFLAIMGCTGSWLYIVRMRKKSRLSELARAESMQWLADTLLSVMIFVGFIAAYALKHTEHAHYARYADPMMVILSAVFFSIVPLKSLVEGIKNILQMAPGGNVYRVSSRMIEAISKKQQFDGFVLRIAKSGRKILYEIGFVSNNPKASRSMAELDDIRQDVENNLKMLHESPIHLDISFMCDKKWG